MIKVNFRRKFTFFVAYLNRKEKPSIFKTQNTLYYIERVNKMSVLNFGFFEL